MTYVIFSAVVSALFLGGLNEAVAIVPATMVIAWMTTGILVAHVPLQNKIEIGALDVVSGSLFGIILAVGTSTIVAVLCSVVS